MRMGESPITGASRGEGWKGSKAQRRGERRLFVDYTLPLRASLFVQRAGHLTTRVQHRLQIRRQAQPGIQPSQVRVAPAPAASTSAAAILTIGSPIGTITARYSRFLLTVHS